MQEIFGIENCSTGMPLDDESNGKECVVCLSEAGFASILIQHSTTRFSSLTRPYSRYKPRHCFSKPLSPLATSAPSLNRPAACVRACVHSSESAAPENVEQRMKKKSKTSGRMTLIGRRATPRCCPAATCACAAGARACCVTSPTGVPFAAPPWRVCWRSRLRRRRPTQPRLNPPRWRRSGGGVAATVGVEAEAAGVEAVGAGAGAAVRVRALAWGRR